MADRKLAYIATISQLDRIPDKDRIAYASFKDLGWQVIVDAANKTGDKVVYIEIDSILPLKPEYEFLRKRCFSEKYNGFVIKGMKMAGLVSFGLALPVPAGYESKPDGFDMTEVLEIRKKEDDVPDVSSAPKSAFENFISWACWKLGIKRRTEKVGVVNGWLSFAHKTDETRIENLPYLFSNEFKGTPIYTTVKCDGQSATFAVYKKHFFIASRNIIIYRQGINHAIKELNPKSKTLFQMDNFRKIAALYDIPQKLYKTSGAKTDVVIQGELCGPGIQKNPMGLRGVDLFVFNIYFPRLPPTNAFEDTLTEVFCSWDGIEGLCNKLGLKTVPFIERKKFDWPDKTALKEYAKGKYPNGEDREGVVIRYDSGQLPMPKALRGMSNMWSFKVINDDYILGK
jgi:hypothetical protein